MAVKKSKTAARKRKPRAKTAAPKSTLKVGGKTFKKVSCHTTKTAATGKAKSIRAGGFNARVVKSGGITCVFKGAKTKANAVGRRRARA